MPSERPVPSDWPPARAASGANLCANYPVSRVSKLSDTARRHRKSAVQFDFTQARTPSRRRRPGSAAPAWAPPWKRPSWPASARAPPRWRGGARTRRSSSSSFDTCGGGRVSTASACSRRAILSLGSPWRSLCKTELPRPARPESIEASNRAARPRARAGGRAQRAGCTGTCTPAAPRAAKASKLGLQAAYLGPVTTRRRADAHSFSV